MCEVREEYNRRMGSIECKFRIICERYHLLAQELAQKNETITRMTQLMTLMETKLQNADNTINELKKQIITIESANQAIFQRHKLNNASSNKHVEQQQQTSSNAIPKIKSIFPMQPQTRIDKPAETFAISIQNSVKNVIADADDDKFDEVLRKLKLKMTSKPFISTIPTIAISKNEAAAPFPTPIQSRGLLSRVRSVENIKNQPVTSEENIKTLQSIWQERDSEISKMDELFQNINNRLKDYEQ